MTETSVNIAGVALKNPVMNASGTFSKEYAEHLDISSMGAVVTKGVSISPWDGNKPPRVAETYGGMLNSIGIQNPGIDRFISEELPFWKGFETKIIVNVAGKTVDEYKEAVLRLNETQTDMLELNFSCPNVKEGGIAFGLHAKTIEKATRAIKRVAIKPIIVKLSPNVADIAEMAAAAESGGADALSLINTLIGMRIDANAGRATLANTFGGLSGPAVKPVALRMVYQASRAVKIPVIGMGGIADGDDAAEFIMAGASAVAVGTANFINKRAVADVADGIKSFMTRHAIRDIKGIQDFFKKDAV